MPTAADRIRLEGYSDADEQRWAPESAKSQERTEFERDRARLIHSSARKHRFKPPAPTTSYAPVLLIRWKWHKSAVKSAKPSASTRT